MIRRRKITLVFTLVIMVGTLLVAVQADSTWSGHRPTQSFVYRTSSGGPVKVSNVYAGSDTSIGLAVENYQYIQNYNGATDPSNQLDAYVLRVMGGANTRVAHQYAAVSYSDQTPFACTALNDPNQPYCQASGLTAHNQGKWFTLNKRSFLYGQPFNQVFVCSNGWAAFTYDGDPNNCPLTPVYFPSPDYVDSSGYHDLPQGIVAPLWKPLDPSRGGQILIQNSGSSPFFIVTWNNIWTNASDTSCNGGPCKNTFTLALTMGVSNLSSNIMFGYMSIDPKDPWNWRESMGLEDQTGTLSTPIDRAQALSKKGVVFQDPADPASSQLTPSYLTDAKIFVDKQSSTDTAQVGFQPYPSSVYGINILTSNPPPTPDNPALDTVADVTEGVLIGGLCTLSGIGDVGCLVVGAAGTAVVGHLIPALMAQPSPPMFNPVPVDPTHQTGYLETPVRQQDGLCYNTSSGGPDRCAVDATVFDIMQWTVPHDSSLHKLNISFQVLIGSCCSYGATSAPYWRSTSVTLSVDEGDFGISPSSPGTVGAGAPANSQVSLFSQNNFANTISLSGTVIPAVSGASVVSGPTVTFSPKNVALPAGGSAASSMTITTTSSTTRQLYNLTVTGTDSTGALIHSSTIQFNVVTPQFAMTVNPNSLALGVGGTGLSASTTITVTNSSFTGQVNIATSISPAVANPPTVSLTAQQFLNPGTIVNSVGVTNPNNAFFQDNVYATIPLPSSTNTANFGSYKYTVVPTPGKIEKVEIGAYHYESGGALSNFHLFFWLYNSNGVLWGQPAIPASASYTSYYYDITTLLAQTGTSLSAFSMAYVVENTNCSGCAGTSYLDWLPLRVTYDTTSVQVTAGSSGSSTLTLTGSPNTPPGQYTVTVTGSSGSATGTAPISLNVTPDFSVTASPTSLNPSKGGTTSTITVGNGGFPGWIGLSVSITPNVSNGPIASLAAATSVFVENPSTVVSTVGGTSIFIFGQDTGSTTAAAAAQMAFAFDGKWVTFATGGSPISATYGYATPPNTNGAATITKVEVGAAHCEDTSPNTPSVSITVNANGASLTQNLPTLFTSGTFPMGPCSGASATGISWVDVTSLTSWTPAVIAQMTTTYTMTPPQYNTGWTYLDWTGVRITYSSTSVLLSPGSSMLGSSGPNTRSVTVATSPSTPGGAYTLTVTGTDGLFLESANVTITIGADFTISVSPSTPASVLAGSTSQSTITLGSIGVAGGVTLSSIVIPRNGLDCGSNCPTTSFATNPVNLTPTGGGTSIMTIYTTPSTPLGSYTITVTGVQGSTTNSTQLSITVLGFGMVSNPGIVNIQQWQSGTTRISLSSLYGFSGTVSLTTSSNSSSVTSSLNATSVSLGSGTTSTILLTITVNPFLTIGNYTITVRGTSASFTASATVLVQVSNFSVSEAATSVSVPVGGSGSLSLTVTSLNGYSGTGNWVVESGIPSCASAGFTPSTIQLPPDGTVPSTLTLNVGIGCATSTNNVVVQFNSNFGMAVSFTLYITDFTLQAAPTLGSVPTGTHGNSTVTIGAINGFSSWVTLSATASPAGLNCSFSNYYIYGSGTSTLSCYGYNFGIYTVTVTGTTGSLSHSVTLSITVKGFAIYVTPSHITLVEGRTGTVTVTGTSFNGYSGTVTLSDTNYCMTSSFSKPTLQLSPGVNDSATLTITPATNCSASTFNQSVGGSDPASTATWGTYFVLTTQDFSIQATVTNVGIGGQTSLKFNVTYTDNNNYPGSILTQSYSFGANNCCLTANVPPTFFIERGDVTSPATRVSSPNTIWQPFSMPWAGQAFYAQGRYWVFFINWASCPSTGANCLFYATSANGVSWTTYNLGLQSGTTPSFVTDGSNVYYVRYNGQGSQGGNAIMFGTGALHADGTIAWRPETTVKPAASGVYWYDLSLRLSSTGQAFVAYQSASQAYGDGYPYVAHSNGRDYSTWQQETRLSNGTDNWRFSLVPLAGGQMYILYWPYWGNLTGVLWSNGGWGSQELITPANTYVQQKAFGFTDGTGNVYAIWQERTSLKIQFATRTVSWGAPQTIGLADVGTNPVWTASYDSLHGKWYIFYYSYSSNQIYQYSGQPGSWSAKTPLFTTLGASSNTLITSFYNSAPVNPYSNTIGMFWTQYDSSNNLQLMFANTTIFAGGSFPATWLIGSTGTRTGTTTLTVTASDGYITRSLTIQISINGYFASVSPNPAGVYIGGSGGTYLQIFPEYGIPLTNSTIVAASIPSCITLGTPNPRYFNVGPVTTLPYVFLPFSASSSCVAGNFQATVTVKGVSTNAYNMNVTFTIWIQTPPSGGGGGGGSIAHGSLVTMADGSKVPVQNLKVGDQLLGYDPTTGRYTVSIITSIKVVDTSNMLIIHTASGTPFRVDANPHQTLWVKTSDGTIGWLSVTLIKPGDYLYTVNGWTPVTSIEFAPAGTHVMYDIVASTPYFADGYLDPIVKT